MIVADYLIKPLHTVATKVPDRNRKWGRLKQAAKLEVFPGLRLASGESGREIAKTTASSRESPRSRREGEGAQLDHI